MSDGDHSGYTEEYYASHLGGEDYVHNPGFVELNRSFAKQIRQMFKPVTVLDVGCACGHLVSALRDEKIAAFGMDASTYALANVRAENQKYCVKSILPEIDLPDSFPVRFDLVTCIEVLEHVPERDAVLSIEKLIQLSDRILFSSTPSDFAEETHINVHPRSYWAKLFAERGFYPDLTSDVFFISPQACLFRKKTAVKTEPFLFLDVEYSHLEASLAKYNEQLRNNLDLLSVNQSLQRKNEALEGEKRDFLSEVSRLQIQRESLQQKNESLQQKNESLQQKNESLQQKNELLTGERNALQSFNQDGQEQQFLLKKRLAQLRDMLEVEKTDACDIISRYNQCVEDNFNHFAAKMDLCVLPESEIAAWGRKALKLAGVYAASQAEENFRTCGFFNEEKYEEINSGTVGKSHDVFRVWARSHQAVLPEYFSDPVLSCIVRFMPDQGDTDDSLTRLLRFWKEIRQSLRLIKQSGLFQKNFYVRQYWRMQMPGIPAELHYLLEGWKTGLNPNPFFDTAFLTNTYPEFRETNPLCYVESHGLSAGFRAEETPVQLSELIRFWDNCGHDFSSVTIPRTAEKAEQRRLTERIDLIIPVYNGLDHLKRLVPSLFENTSPLHRFIFVDDCSPDPEVIPYLKKMTENRTDCMLLQNEKNLGFPGTVNHAVSCVASSVFVLVNTDVLVPPQWLERLMEPFFQSQTVATATPFTNSAVFFSFPDFGKDNKLKDIGNFTAIDDVFSKISVAYSDRICDSLSGTGFCMGIRKSVWDLLGGFDAVTFEKGYGEETDWCFRALNAGYRHVIVPNLFVYHNHGGTFNSEYKKKKVQEHLEIIRERWPEILEGNNHFAAADPWAGFRYAVFQQLHPAEKRLDHLIIDLDSSAGGACAYRMQQEKRMIEQGERIATLTYTSTVPTVWKLTYITPDLSRATFPVGTFSNVPDLVFRLDPAQIFLNNLAFCNDVVKMLDFFCGRIWKVLCPFSQADASVQSLSKGMRLEQDFCCSEYGLDGIALFFGTYNRRNHSSTLIEIVDPFSQQILFSHCVDNEKLADNREAVIYFDRTLDLQQDFYTIRLTSDSDFNNCVAVYANKGYNKISKCRVNGQKIDSCLCLSLLSSGNVFDGKIQLSEGTVPLSYFLDDRIFTQQFQASMDRLTGLIFMAGTYGRANKFLIRLCIRDQETGEVLSRGELPADTLIDNEPFLISFPEIRHSAGRKFLAELTSTGASRENTVALYGKSGDQSLSLNGVPLKGQFVCSCSYIKNDIPAKKYPVEYQFHDFLSCCYSFFLMGPDQVFCNYKHCKSPEKCFRVNSHSNSERSLSLGEWREKWRDFLSQCSRYRFFSENTKRLVSEIYSLDPGKTTVKPHNIGIKFPEIFKCPDTACPFHIAVIGAWAIPKGSDMVLRLAAEWRKKKPDAKIFFYGKDTGDSPLSQIKKENPNIVFRGTYTRTELVHLLIQDKISLIFMSSVCPETFSLVTSECIAMQVPIISFAVGAHGDRIRDYQYGMLIPEITERSMLETFELAEKRFYNPAPVKRLVLFMHFDVDNCISDEDVYYLQQLYRCTSEIIFISNSALDEPECSKIRAFCPKIILSSKNKGYDFYAWKKALCDLPQEYLQRFDELLFVNNSCFGPLFDLSVPLNQFSSSGVDFGGMVLAPAGKSINFTFPEHLQSFFLIFNRRVFQSDIFQKFMANIQCETELMEVVRKYETQLTKTLKDAGFTCHSVFHAENDFDSLYIQPQHYMREMFPLGKKKFFSMVGDQQILSDYVSYLKQNTCYPGQLLLHLIGQQLPKNHNFSRDYTEKFLGMVENQPF